MWTSCWTRTFTSPLAGALNLEAYAYLLPLLACLADTPAQQDSFTEVRYFIKVMETTTLYIIGGENSIIHSVYVSKVVHALDRFAGQEHSTMGKMSRTFDIPEARIRQAVGDWRKWLEQ